MSERWSSTKEILGFCISLVEIVGLHLRMPAEVLFTIAKTWKQPNFPSTDEWIKEMWHIYTMEYYSAIKRKETELFILR